MGSKLYEIIKNIRPKRFIVILVFLLVLFFVQSIILYGQFIPNVVAIYEGILPPDNLIALKAILEKIASWYLVWPILTISQLIVIIFLARKIQKNI